MKSLHSLFKGYPVPIAILMLSQLKIIFPPSVIILKIAPVLFKSLHIDVDVMAGGGVGVQGLDEKRK